MSSKTPDAAENPEDQPLSLDIGQLSVQSRAPSPAAMAEDPQSQHSAQGTTETVVSPPHAPVEPPPSHHFSIEVIEVGPPSPDTTEVTEQPPLAPATMETIKNLPSGSVTTQEPANLELGVVTVKEPVVNPGTPALSKARLAVPDSRTPPFSPVKKVDEPEELEVFPQGEVEACTQPLTRTKTIQPSHPLPSSSSPVKKVDEREESDDEEFALDEIEACTHPLTRTKSRKPAPSDAGSPPPESNEEQSQRRRCEYINAFTVLGEVGCQLYIQWQITQNLMPLGFISDIIHWHEFKESLRSESDEPSILDYGLFQNSSPPPESSKAGEKRSRPGLWVTEKCGHAVHPALVGELPFENTYCPVCIARILLDHDADIRRA